MVHLARHQLEEDGIECVVRGEDLVSAFGGGWASVWVELWLLDETQSDAALAVIDRMLDDDDGDAEPWICPDCIEWRDGAYSHCWKCGAERLD